MMITFNALEDETFVSLCHRMRYKIVSPVARVGIAKFVLSNFLPQPFDFSAELVFIRYCFYHYK